MMENGEWRMENGSGNRRGISRAHSPFSIFHFRSWVSPFRHLLNFGDNVSLALGALRVAKMRSALTILGVVIGVSCVMAMASIVRGIQDQILHTLEVAGPSTFYVVKVFSETPLNPENLPKWVRVRPDL